MVDFALANQAQEVLEKHWGHVTFRPGQSETIYGVLKGRDTLIVMPTGGGKSACYQIPGCILPGVTLVISPLIALMKDQVDDLNARGIPATFINSSIAPEEQQARLDDVHRGVYNLLYIAPERFKNQTFLHQLRTLPVNLLAVDEAHCISQWGHDFRPDYRRIGSIRQEFFPDVPTIALTATATTEVQKDIIKQLKMVNPSRRVTGFDRPNLHLKIDELPTEYDRRKALFRRLDEILNTCPQPIAPSQLPAMVLYAGTQKATDELSAEINDKYKTFLAHSYHAGRKAADRTRIQNEFMAGTVPWVVATCAFGMGVDKPNIRYVLHATLPGSIESYYQEVGRAGRDGEDSWCEMLLTSSDIGLQHWFVDNANPQAEVFEKLQDLLTNIADGRRVLKMTYKQVYERWAQWYGKKDHEMKIGNAIRAMKKHNEMISRESKRGQLILHPEFGTIDLVDGFGFDFPAMAAKLKHDRERLHEMVSFTKARDLRRAILTYFGETNGSA